MPTYCYTHAASGRTIEAEYPMARIPKFLRRDGFLFLRDLNAEHAGQKSGDAWTEHWSMSMGARTPQHGKEIAARCLKAGVDVKFRFGDFGPIEVKKRSHQKKLMAVAHADQGRMVNFDDY